MNPTNIHILNAKGQLPADGFYHIVPLGDYPIQMENKNGEWGRVMQRLDSEALAGMVRAFEGEADLLVDYDHFSTMYHQRSEAAGWIKELVVRNDGLWARIEWTDTGLADVENKRYRFVSPTWQREDVEWIDSETIRPLRLDSLAVTNNPNLKGMQPLSNSGGGDRLPNSHRNKETQSVKKVLELLGLSADASEDSAADAVNALKNRAAEADVLKNRAETAEQKLSGLEQAGLEADADAFCEKYADHIANRDAVREQFIANRESTEKLFAGLKAQAKEPDGKAPAFRNRKGAEDAGAVKNRKEQQQAKISEIRNRTGCSNTEAFEQAARENPELFTEECE